MELAGGEVQETTKTRKADLYGLYLVLSEMGRKVAGISEEERVGYVQDNLEENLKDLSKMFRVLTKELHRNIQPEANPQVNARDPLLFCREMREQLSTLVLKFIKSSGGGEAGKGLGEDVNMQEDQTREIVELVMEVLEQKFGRFCEETNSKTLQALAVLEYCWKLLMLPYETIYCNRDFLVE